MPWGIQTSFQAFREIDPMRLCLALKLWGRRIPDLYSIPVMNIGISAAADTAVREFRLGG